MSRFSASFRMAARVTIGLLIASSLAWLTASPAAASHFRFRDMTWQLDHTLSDGTPVVELSMRIADRASYYGGMRVGDPFSAYVDLDDGTYEELTGPVIAVNSVDDWFIAEVSTLHAVPGGGPVTVSWSSCCTLSSLRNSPDASLRTTTVIDLSDGNTASPTSLVSPIVHLPAADKVQKLRIPATDIDGTNVSFRLATEAESYTTQPPGLSIDERTGVLSWDTSGLPNGLWLVTVVLSDPAGASSMNTFLIDLGGSASAPPAWIDTTPPDRSNLSAPVGGVVRFDLTAMDPDGDRVTITQLNAVDGLLCPEVVDTDRTYLICGWRPTVAGTHLVAFDAQDPSGASAGLRVYRLTTPRYVAFGDSYSSGEGALDEDNYEEGTNKDTGGNGCRRASTSYPALMAATTDPDLGIPQDFDFVACSGARTWHFEEAQHPDGPGKPQPAQFDLAALGQDTELVTLSIGGNDAMFASILKNCIGIGLLGADCSAFPDKSEDIVQDAFARLRGEPTRHGLGEEKTIPLAQLYSRIIREAPRARVIVMGYPQFFRTGGTLLFKCSGVTKMDQIWVNEKVEEMNDLLEAEASSLGLEFIDPSDAFEGHRLCEVGGGEDREWFRDIVLEADSQVKDDASFHPDDDGHFAEYQLLLDKWANPPATFIMNQGDWRNFYVEVTGDPQAWLDLFARWPGSDVEMTVTSPSGRTYTRASHEGALHLLGPTFESLRIPTPEPGRWEVALHGTDIGADGEPVSFQSQVRPEWNYPPVARMTSRLDGRTLHLDGTDSSDPEGGALTSYDWVIRTSEGTVVAELSGRQATYTFERGGDYVVSLRVADEAGKLGFGGLHEALEVRPYVVTGPAAPLRAEGWNQVNAGRTIPVRWRLTTIAGEPVSAASSVLGIETTPVSCADAHPTGPAQAAGDPGLSGLRYEGDGRWQFNVQTSPAWADTCRRLTVTFDDGSSLSANVKLS